VPPAASLATGAYRRFPGQDFHVQIDTAHCGTQYELVFGQRRIFATLFNRFGEASREIRRD